MKAGVVGALVLMSGMLFSEGVAAAWQSSPGSACESATGSQISLYNKVGDTGLVRTGSSSGWVSCPIHRTLLVRGTVYVNLFHPTGRTTTCKLVRSDYQTGASKSVSASTTGTGNRFVQLSGANLGTMQTWDVFTISCNVAQGTVIRGTSWADN